MSDASSTDPGNGEPDWFFAFAGDGTNPQSEPPGAVVDALEFAKATLHQQLADVRRTSRHLESLLRRSQRAGLSVDDLAVHAGLGREAVVRVLSGTPLIDVLLGKTQ
jgi:hypothetical protein